MSPYWFAGGAEYDKLCQPFCPVIRAVGKQEFGSNQKEWQGTVDGKVSQLVLCDQLSRNCFRGTDEAFEFDSVGEAVACGLGYGILSGNVSNALEGEFYPAYSTFVITALVHSEVSENHETALALIDWAKGNTSDQLSKCWDNQRVFALEHKQDIDRFGRYPHRNGKLGRESTPEEEEWLANKDELPGWAKSQM